MTKSQGIDLVSKYPRSRSDGPSEGRAGTSSIHGGPTSQTTGCKASTVNILVAETIGHPRGSLSMTQSIRAISDPCHGSSLRWSNRNIL